MRNNRWIRLYICSNSLFDVYNLLEVKFHRNPVSFPNWVRIFPGHDRPDHSLLPIHRFLIGSWGGGSIEIQIMIDPKQGWNGQIGVGNDPDPDPNRRVVGKGRSEQGPRSVNAMPWYRTGTDLSGLIPNRSEERDR